MAIVRLDKQALKLQKRSKRGFVAARVIDIILDDQHPQFETMGYNDSIGTIYYTVIDQETPLENPNIAPTARPLFSFVKSYPLINELVLLITTYDKEIYDVGGQTTYYLPHVNIWNHPHHNALPSLRDLDQEGVRNDYEASENGAITREVEDDGTDIPLGKYFDEQLDIKPLLPYEGDTIIEGRFGNSIRLGSTNYDEEIPDNLKNNWSRSDRSKTGDPITIIRNGQSNELDEKGWIHTVEEINGDFTSIYLTSNQQVTNLKVASMNVKSYEAEEEPVDAFDPLRFEALTRDDTVYGPDPEPSTPSSQPLPDGEESVINSPPADVKEEEESAIDDLDDKDPDYYDKNPTENEDRKESDEPSADTITSNGEPEFDMNELMG